MIRARIYIICNYKFKICVNQIKSRPITDFERSTFVPSFLGEISGKRKYSIIL